MTAIKYNDDDECVVIIGKPTDLQVEAALFARGIRRAERRRVGGFEEYRLRDGCWPGTFYEAVDRVHWAWMRVLVGFGVGRFIKWLRGVLG